MSNTLIEAGPTALAERPEPLESEDEFALDPRVVTAIAPIGHTMCDTSDGCGNTCANGASSCNSFTDDPS